MSPTTSIPPPGRRPGPPVWPPSIPRANCPRTTGRFALDHDHPAHLEGQDGSPFAAGDLAEQTGGGSDHDHLPWTATSRGIETSLRRLAILEPVHRLAPDLKRSGRVNRPARDTAASREVRMTDFRLLRHGCFCLAVPEYGPDLWPLLRSLTPVSTPQSGRCGARSSTASGASTAIPTPTMLLRMYIPCN